MTLTCRAAWLRICEGATEVQQLIIGKSVLKAFSSTIHPPTGEVRS